MKTSCQDNAPRGFCPKELTIQLETAEEYALMKLIVGSNVSVANMLRSESRISDERREQVIVMLEDIYRELVWSEGPFNAG